MADNAVTIKNLTKVYGNDLKALDDVSLEIPKGSFFGLLGPNGAGKTTLISTLGGLTLPTTGTLNILGHDVNTQSAEARHAIGIVPQEIVYDPFFSTRQYLRQQSSYYGLYKNDDWIDELLERLSLTDKADENTRKLSGGMKRRMMVALAMVHKPPVVILDEPTAGVDVSQRRNLWEFIQELNKDGVTVILTTHYLEEAEENCEYICMLDKGKVIANEKTADLLNSSWHHTRCLHVKLDNDAKLPDDIFGKQVTGPNSDGIYHISFDNYSEVEQITRKLNETNLSIAEMNISSADLEDVFIQMTKQA